MARYAPLPATTKLPDITLIAGVLRDRVGLAGEQGLVDLEVGLLEHLAVDDDLVAGSEFDDVVEHHSLGVTATVPDCLRTNGFACPTMASLSSVCLARSSWMMPIALLAMISNPKAPLITEPVDSTMISSTPRMALIRVNTLARTMSDTLRAARVGTSLVLPSETRLATSASVSPVATIVVNLVLLA